MPVNGEVGSGFRTASRPTHQGVDLMVPRNTVIHAASAGLVVKVRCQAHLANGTEWGGSQVPSVVCLATPTILPHRWICWFRWR